MFNGTFEDIVLKEDGFLRGPFGSALKKSLFVPKAENTYKVYEQGVVLEQNKNVGNYYISEEYFNSSMKRFAVKEGDFLVSCSGVNYGAIYQLTGKIEQGVINQALLRIRVNEDIIDPDYFLYYFRTYIVRAITSGTGDSTIPNFPPMSTIKKIPVSLPDIKIQKKVGKFLRGMEKILNSNNERIQYINEMMEMVYNYNLIQNKNQDDWKTKKVGKIVNVITGKKDANFSNENGKYKFFTCSNAVLKCNEYEYEGKSVLIAGNGDFNVKYYNGKFNAYQRTYILQPENSKYIGLIYQSAIRLINIFKKTSNGSIVKFITKGDIENIEIVIPNDDKLINLFNTSLDLIQKLNEENEKIQEIQNYIQPLIISGKVTL